MFESLGDTITIILSIGAVIGLTIRYIGDYLRNSKELEVFGSNKDLPEPLRTILNLAQFSQMHGTATLEQKINDLTMQVHELMSMVATMRAQCLTCTHLDPNALRET